MLRLVINLDRSPERMVNMQKQFDEMGLAFQRLPGVDASLLSQEELSKYALPFEKRRYYLSDLSPGEFGCCLSHIKAAHTLLDSNENWALVCEDDIRITPEAKIFMQDTSWIPQDVKLVNLANGYKANITVYREREMILPNGTRLLETVTGYGGAQAYLIHREAAQNLVNICQDGFLSAIDDILFQKYSSYRQTTTPWSLSPAVVFNNDQGCSLIGKSRTKIKSPWFKSPSKYIERKLLKWKLKWDCRFTFTKDTK